MQSIAWGWACKHVALGVLVMMGKEYSTHLERSPKP